MKKSLAELHQERARLVERIGAERAAVGRQLAPFQRAAETSEKVSAFVARAVAYARAHPLTLVAGLAVLVVLRPRSSLRWAQRGFLIWRGWRTVRGWQPMRLVQLAKRFF